MYLLFVTHKDERKHLDAIIMEEIYIIKLKGLPTSSEESLRDNKASFYYRKDLTGEALLGFGLFHSFIGAALITLSIINLTLSGEQNSEQIGSGIWCGAIFVISGLTGVMTSQKRKSDISKSKIQVKIFFAMTITSLLLTIAFITLFIFGMFWTCSYHVLRERVWYFWNLMIRYRFLNKYYFIASSFLMGSF